MLRSRYKAEISVFLSLLFLLLVAVVIALLESVSFHVSKNIARGEVGLALYSVFGEYHRLLFEEYHILALDGSYGVASFSEQNLLNRIRYYGKLDMEHELTALQLLTDNQGRVFREQVLLSLDREEEYEPRKDFLALLNFEEVSERDEEHFEVLKARMSDKIDQHKEELLFWVLPSEFHVFNTEQSPLIETLSQRRLNNGFGNIPNNNSVYELPARMLFDDYIVENFAFATSSFSRGKDEGVLSFEVEYVIAGQESEWANLIQVASDILLIRCISNYALFSKEPILKDQAAVVAELMPFASSIEPQEIEKLILLWIFWESVLEVKSLYRDGRVPVEKTVEQWQLSLTDTVDPELDISIHEAKTISEGWDYQDFLRVLLYRMDEELKAMRTMGCIEENFRQRIGLSDFYMDHLIVKLYVENIVRTHGNKQYQFPAVYGYR